MKPAPPKRPRHRKDESRETWVKKEDEHKRQLEEWAIRHNEMRKVWIPQPDCPYCGTPLELVVDHKEPDMYYGYDEDPDHPFYCVNCKDTNSIAFDYEKQTPEI